jgi:hypothetical protein
VRATLSHRVAHPTAWEAACAFLIVYGTRKQNQHGEYLVKQSPIVNGSNFDASWG